MPWGLASQSYCVLDSPGARRTHLAGMNWHLSIYLYFKIILYGFWGRGCGHICRSADLCASMSAYANQPTPSIFLALPPQHWDYGYVPPHLPFYRLQRLNSSPHACRASAFLTELSPQSPSLPYSLRVIMTENQGLQGRRGSLPSLRFLWFPRGNHNSPRGLSRCRGLWSSVLVPLRASGQDKD